MDFSHRGVDPKRHVIGFMTVVLFHGFIVYALVTGLAKKVVDVVRAPIETKVIEEIKKPPPPPEIALPPPPKLEAPPPPFIPPPEVQIATPPPPAATITAVTPTPPPANVVIAPARVVVEAPPPPPVPKPASIGVYCSKMPLPEVPGVEFTGRIDFVAQITIKANKVVHVDVVPGTFTGTRDRKIQRAFMNSVTEAVMQYTCVADSVVVTQPFGFSIN